MFDPANISTTRKPASRKLFAFVFVVFILSTVSVCNLLFVELAKAVRQLEEEPIPDDFYTRLCGPFSEPPPPQTICSSLKRYILKFQESQASTAKPRIQ